MTERLCKWCDTPLPEEAPRPGPRRMFCSKEHRRSWHYWRNVFLEGYAEECRRRQRQWESTARGLGPERADKELAPAIERVAERIARFELDLEPWKPDRRKAPRKGRSSFFVCRSSA